jgi:deoxyadenosine/deoxycytidine kinase
MPSGFKKLLAILKPNFSHMHIAVAGNIGAGKSTLAQKLAQHYKWEVFYESVDDNPYLEDFYSDMHKWAFHLQVYFLSTRIQQVLDIQAAQHTIIQDRTIYEDAVIFAKNLHASGHINPRDYANYLNLFETMTGFVKSPDLLIYLRAGMPTLVERIEKRGRDYENNIKLEYLRKLGDAYEDWISTYNKGKLLIINADQLDFVARPEDLGKVIEKVDRELYGIFSND